MRHATWKLISRLRYLPNSSRGSSPGLEASITRMGIAATVPVAGAHACPWRPTPSSSRKAVPRSTSTEHYPPRTGAKAFPCSRASSQGFVDRRHPYCGTESPNMFLRRSRSCGPISGPTGTLPPSAGVKSERTKYLHVIGEASGCVSRTITAGPAHSVLAAWTRRSHPPSPGYARYPALCKNRHWDSKGLRLWGSARRPRGLQAVPTRECPKTSQLVRTGARWPSSASWRSNTPPPPLSLPSPDERTSRLFYNPLPPPPSLRDRVGIWTTGVAGSSFPHRVDGYSSHIGASGLDRPILTGHASRPCFVVLVWLMPRARGAPERHVKGNTDQSYRQQI